MRLQLISLPLFLAACAPAISDVATPGGPMGTDGTDGTGGTDDAAGTDGTDGTALPEARVLVSGEWAPTGLEVDDDPCRWATSMEWVGLSLSAVLPEAFDVDASENSFEIEAVDYGAQGPITCTIEDDAFSCEQQRVEPNAYGLGRAGWEYAIDFSGDVESDNVLRGTAVVSFPQVDSQSQGWLDYYDIALEDCTQVFTLELSIAN